MQAVFEQLILTDSKKCSSTVLKELHYNNDQR